MAVTALFVEYDIGTKSANSEVEYQIGEFIPLVGKQFAGTKKTSDVANEAPAVRLDLDTLFPDNAPGAGPP